jgi:predicted RNA-binding protein with PIN domain
VAKKTTVLVDARNVLRSQWPNLPEEELVARAGEWARRNGHEVVLVFDGKAPGEIVGSERHDAITTLVGTGSESADDWLIREVPSYRGAWLVTSDRALREAAGTHASKLVGGGSFLRQLGE